MLLGAKKEAVKLANEGFFSVINLKIMTEKDFELADYISEVTNFNVCDSKKVAKKKKIQEVVNESIDSLSIFNDDEIISKTKAIVFSVPLNSIYTNPNVFGCVVGYNHSDVEETKKGEVLRYNIPNKLNELSSIQLGAQHIHALKETNAKEHENTFVTGNVLSFLYELISIEQQDINFQKDYLNMRLQYLNACIFEYKNARDVYNNKEKNDSNEEQVYFDYLNRVGAEINSFYYALILYNLYKNDPTLITNYVNKVLNHELTTVDVLEELAIYQEYNKEVYEEELSNIAKLTLQ